MLLGYCVVAGALNVSLVFAAFLAGFAVVHTKRRLFAEALDAIGKEAIALVVSLYFEIVVLKLALVDGFWCVFVCVLFVDMCEVTIRCVFLTVRF